MAVLTQPGGYPRKNLADPQFFVGLTNQHAAFGKIVSNSHIFALAGEEGRRHKRYIIQPGISDGFGRSANR